jgi:hypothetical protein
VATILKTTVIPESLVLEEGSIDPNQLSIGTLMRELNLSKQPSWWLRTLMSALETQRIARKLGWSRPWNKDGLTIFRSLRHFIPEDVALLNLVRFSGKHLWPGASDEYRLFIEDLLADKGLMGFSFHHNHFRDGEFHEGVTLSFGRKVIGDRSKRDRLDIILEDRREGNEVDGRLNRIRIFANPWKQYQSNQYWKREIGSDNPDTLVAVQPLYDSCCAAYMKNKDISARQFEHWSIRLIDYFGPRDFIPRGSRFI